MIQPRSILLRRPPTLSVVEEPFVPDGDPAEIDARWSAFCERYPHAYDGRLCHVLGVHRNGCGGAAVHVVECAYRYQAVQDESFDLGIRALGVKGITRRPDGHVLLGKRSMRVGGYPGRWELAPGGVVEPGDDPRDTVVRELHEETTLTCAEPLAVALLYDDVQRSWEVVFRIAPDHDRTPAFTDEYDALRWCAPDAIDGPLTPVADRMRELL